MYIYEEGINLTELIVGAIAPEKVIGIVFVSLLGALFLLVIVRMVMKVIKNQTAHTQTVEAVVIDKNTVETFSKYSGNSKKVKFVVAFMAEGRKKTFYVSEFSYNGYEIGEKGKLTYRGDMLISFK